MTDSEKIADLERRVARLEKGIHRNGEVPTPPIQWPATPNIGEKRNPRCGKCNIELAPIMSYCCPRADCPCGLGGISCTVATDSISRNT